MEVLLGNWSERSEENARGGRKKMQFGVQNSRKANDGRLAGLLDPRVDRRKNGKAEAGLQGAKLADETRMEAVVESRHGSLRQDCQCHQNSRGTGGALFTLLEGSSAFNSDGFRIARTLLRAER